MNAKEEEVINLLKVVLKKLDKISKELKTQRYNPALTPMQDNVLKCVTRLSLRRKKLPTARDISKALGRKESTTYHHLEILERKGIIGKISELKKIKKGRAKKVPVSRYYVIKAP